jgi:hypothetical protein
LGVNQLEHETVNHCLGVSEHCVGTESPHNGIAEYLIHVGVAWCVVPDVLKEGSFGLLDGQFEGTKTVRNAGKYGANTTAFHVRESKCSVTALLTDGHLTHLNGTESEYHH